MIDVLVPQMVDQLAEVVKFFVTLLAVAEQVIEATTITLEDIIAQRAPLQEPQLVEQLVEVPACRRWRRRCWHNMGRRWPRVVPLLWGGGSRVRDTPSGAPQRESPPAQSGI